MYTLIIITLNVQDILYLLPESVIACTVSPLPSPRPTQPPTSLYLCVAHSFAEYSMQFNKNA